MSTKQQKSQKQSQKGTQELDFFIEYIQKKVRTANKKLKQIADLETIETDQLNAEQRKKIESKQEIYKDIDEYSKIEAFYLKALKEQKKTNKAAAAAENDAVQLKTIRQIVDLTYLAQFYEVFSVEQQQDDALPKSIENLKQIYDFYNKTLVFNSNIKEKQTVNQKLEKAIHDLHNYVKGFGEHQKLLYLAANSAEMKIFASKKGSEIVQPKELIKVETKTEEHKTEKVAEQKEQQKEVKDQKEQKEVKDQKEQKEQKEEVQIQPTEEVKQQEKKFVLTKLEDLPENKRKKTVEYKKIEKIEPKQEQQQQQRKKTTDLKQTEADKKDEFNERKLSTKDEAEGFVEIKKKQAPYKKSFNQEKKKKYQQPGQAKQQKKGGKEGKVIQYVKKEVKNENEEQQ